VRDQFPESQAALDKFAEAQDKIGVNLDRDILQSFTGELACVSVPVTMADGTKHQTSVTALKCQNPDKIRELLGRAVDALNKLPAVQTQQFEAGRLQKTGRISGSARGHLSDVRRATGRRIPRWLDDYVM